MEGSEPPKDGKERKGGEILGEHSDHFKYSALGSAVYSPAQFAGAATNDIGKELLGKTGEEAHTAIQQLLRERGPEWEDRALRQAEEKKRSVNSISETNDSKFTGIPKDGRLLESLSTPGKSPKKGRGSFSSSRWLLNLGTSGSLQGKQTATPRAAQHYEVHDDVILQLDAQLSAAKMHVASPSAGSPGRAKLAWWQTPLET